MAGLAECAQGTSAGVTSLNLTNSSGNPFNQPWFLAQSGDFQRRQTVFVASRKIGSVFDENRERLWAGVPLGSEMGGGSAAECAGIDVRAVRDQPANRPVIRLMRECLQWRAFAADSAVDRHAPIQECFGDIVRRPPMTLKMSECSGKMLSAGARSMFEQPANQPQILRGPAGAE